MSDQPAAIITREPDHLPTLTAALAHVKLVQQITEQVMVEGVHYGPGFPGDKKKNLHKPGAEKLCLTFRLVPQATVTMTELPNGHREYYTVIRLITPNGNTAGEGYGTCSTMEAKHRYRNARPICPDCKKETVIKTERGWWCAPRDGGCGANPAPGEIEKQKIGKIENPNPADCYNACLKVSHKRALVHATIQATAASDIFDQDAEDIEGKEDAAKADDVAKGKVPPPTQQAPAPQAPAPLNFDVWSKEAEAVVFKDLKEAVGIAVASAMWEAHKTQADWVPEKVKAAKEVRFADFKAIVSAIREMKRVEGDVGAQIVADEIEAHGGKDMKRRAVDSLRARLVRHSSGEGAQNGEVPPGLND